MRSLLGADQESSVPDSKNELAAEWGILVVCGMGRTSAVWFAHTADGRTRRAIINHHYLMPVNSAGYGRRPARLDFSGAQQEFCGFLSLWESAALFAVCAFWPGGSTAKSGCPTRAMRLDGLTRRRQSGDWRSQGEPARRAGEIPLSTCDLRAGTRLCATPPVLRPFPDETQRRPK